MESVSSTLPPPYSKNIDLLPLKKVGVVDIVDMAKEDFIGSVAMFSVGRLIKREDGWVLAKRMDNDSATDRWVRVWAYSLLKLFPEEVWGRDKWECQYCLNTCSVGRDYVSAAAVEGVDFVIVENKGIEYLVEPVALYSAFCEMGVKDWWYYMYRGWFNTRIKNGKDYYGYLKTLSAWFEVPMHQMEARLSIKETKTPQRKDF